MKLSPAPDGRYIYILPQSKLGAMSTEKLQKSAILASSGKDDHSAVTGSIDSDLEKVLLLNSLIPQAVTAHVLLGSITTVVMWNEVSRPWLAAWLSIFIAIQLVRFLLAKSSKNPHPSTVKKTLYKLRASTFASGLGWGMIPVVLFPDDLPHQIFIPFVAAGVTGAAVAGLSFDRVSAISFVASALLPLITRLFTVEGEIPTAMGVMVTLYFMFLLSAIERGVRAFQDTLALRQRVDHQNSQLREAQQLALIGSYDWNPVTGELHWSDEHYRLWGLEPSACPPSYELFHDVIHKEDLQRFDDALSAALRNETPLDQTYRITTKDGVERYIRSLGHVLFDHSGAPVRMLGTAQDVTAMVRAEQEIRANEERLSFLISSSPAITYTCEVKPPFGATFIGPGVKKLFGYDPDQFTHDPNFWASLIHPDDAQLVLENLPRLFERGEYEHEYRFLRADGAYRWMHDKLSLIRGENGDPVEIIGFWMDIHDRKIAEDELEVTARERGERAKESNCVNAIVQVLLDESRSDDEVLSEVVELIPSGCKCPGNMNARICIGDREFVGPNFRETAWRFAVDIPTLGRGKYLLELFSTQGATDVIDISEQKRAFILNIAMQIGQALSRRLANREMIRARDEANRANKAKSEFLSSMSHELRTPMNAILGFSQLMELDEKFPVQHRDGVKEILKAGEHLLELINEVLDLSKIESGRFEVFIELVELKAVLNECVGLVFPLAEKHAVQVKLSHFDEAVVRADRVRLKQALLNLLSNAIKYNRTNGSVTLNVQVGSEGRLRINVTDTGYGIPENRLPELFQPFNRLGAESTDTEGTGIGLTITRRIVEVMGGAMGVASKFGSGSTFWIELPHGHITSSPLGTQMEYTDHRPRTPKSTAQNGVLYIVDNPSDLAWMEPAMALRPDIEFFATMSAERGLEIARTHRPSLILLDFNMPGMSSNDLITVLRADVRTKSIPVVAISPQVMEHNRGYSFAAEHIEYVTKPMDLTQLYRVLDTLLRVESKKAVG